MKAKRVGIVELAKACGVSKTTVSAALGATGRVSEAMRKKVRAEARRRGWRPDPHVAQLMGYLRQSRRAATTCNLAWLNSAADERCWHDRPWFAGYLKGARRRAAELGYGLDEVWTRAEGTSAAALARQLKARGVAGVLLPLPADEPVVRKLAQQNFARVVVDEAELELPFPCVQADRHANMRLLLESVSKLGYKRPGLALDPYVDRISAHSYSSAYLGWCRMHGVAPCLLDLEKGGEAEAISGGLLTAGPDILIGSDNRLAEWCGAAGFPVPERIGVAHLNLASDVTGWAGIGQNHEQIGATAVDQLASLLTLRQFATPDRRTVLVPGVWRAGKTTPNRLMV